MDEQKSSTSLPPRYILFASWGNDSVALVQWAHERGLKDVLVVHNDTGWAESGWADRVARGAKLCSDYGFDHEITTSCGMVALVKRKKGWPRQGLQFCTEELKSGPSLRLLDRVDPDKSSVICVGVRREESQNRRAFPEYVEESERHGGRSLWAPLVLVSEEERDRLVCRAGFSVLPHRSRECYPCVNSNKKGLSMLQEERISFIEKLEQELGHTSLGKPRVMFRPYRCMGATGIREVVRWANSARGTYAGPEDDDNQAGGTCDGGFCGD